MEEILHISLVMREKYICNIMMLGYLKGRSTFLRHTESYFLWKLASYLLTLRHTLEENFSPFASILFDDKVARTCKI